jgi:hypothetical protein
MAASVSEKPEWMHKTTTAIMKRPIQLRNRGHQRTFCYMALGYQQISAWDCAPPSSRSRPQRRLPFLRSSTSSCRRAGSARAVSEQIRDTDRMNKGVHPRKEHLDFSAHGSRQRRRDSAGQKEPTGRTTPWQRRRRRGREVRAVAVEGYLDVRGGRRGACAAMLGWGEEGAVVVGIGAGLERAE